MPERNHTNWKFFHSLFRKMADNKLYDILGVARNASNNDIKKVKIIIFTLCFIVLCVVK